MKTHREKLLHHLGTIFGAVMFAVAVYVLYHELGKQPLGDVLAEFRKLSVFDVLLALGFTAGAYVAMLGIEKLAVRYIEEDVSWRRALLVSFLANTFAHNATGIAGTAVRFRLYRAWRVPRAEVTIVVGFIALTFWLGFLTLAGIDFIIEPLSIPPAIHLWFSTARPLGTVFLGILLAYLTFTVSRIRPVRVFGKHLPIPLWWLSALQMAFSAAEWCLAGAVFYAVIPLPSNLSFPMFLGMFMLARIAGNVSHVPGGLGVFDSLMLIMLEDTVPASAAIGGLLAFRGIFYLLPLVPAAVMLVVYEGRLKRARRERMRLEAQAERQQCLLNDDDKPAEPMQRQRTR